MAFHTAVFILLSILLSTAYGTEPRYYYEDGCTNNITINQTVYLKRKVLDVAHTYQKPKSNEGWTYRIDLNFTPVTRTFAQASWSSDYIPSQYDGIKQNYQCWVAIFQTFPKEIKELNTGLREYHHQILRILWILPFNHPPYIYFYWKTYHHHYQVIKAYDIEPNSYYLFRQVPAFLNYPLWRFWITSDLEWEMRLSCATKKVCENAQLIRPEVFLGKCRSISKNLKLLRCQLLPYIFHCNKNIIPQCGGHDWYKFPVKLLIPSPETKFPVQKFKRESPEIPINIPWPLPIPIQPKSINFNFFDNRRVATAIMIYAIIVALITIFSFIWVLTWE